MKRIISKEVYWGALARFMIAREKQSDVDKLEQEMNTLLGDIEGSHMSDEIYMRSTKNARFDFDKALSYAEILVDEEES